MSNLGRRRDWTVLKLIEWSGQYLEEKGVERGRLDAEHLLAHAMSTTRLDYIFSMIGFFLVQNSTSTGHY